MPTPTVIKQYQYSDAINRRNWDSRYGFDQFTVNPISAAAGGGAATGVAGDKNVLYTQFGQYEYNVIGTQTVLAPKLGATGLNLVQTATASQGSELTVGQTSLSPAAFTVGTDAAFFCQAIFTPNDVSGLNPLILGFRKVQAFNATLSSYTDFASIGIVGTSNPNLIKLQTQLASGGVTTTDTTQTVADSAVIQLKVKVSAAGVVTYELNYGAPTVVAAFSFAAGTVVIPFIRCVQAADVAETVDLSWFEYGFQS